MNPAIFGTLQIGPIPRVVGTLSSYDSLARFTSLTDKVCDIVEVRLDHVGTSNDWLNQSKSIEASRTPVVLTLRSASEGGKSHLEDSQRKAIFDTALPFLSAIDVEFKSGLAHSLYTASKALGKAVIVSFH